MSALAYPSTPFAFLSVLLHFPPTPVKIRHRAEPPPPTFLLCLQPPMHYHLCPSLAILSRPPCSPCSCSTLLLPNHCIHRRSKLFFHRRQVAAVFTAPSPPKGPPHSRGSILPLCHPCLAAVHHQCRLPTPPTNSSILVHYSFLPPSLLHVDPVYKPLSFSLLQPGPTCQFLFFFLFLFNRSNILGYILSSLSFFFLANLSRIRSSSFELRFGPFKFLNSFKFKT